MKRDQRKRIDALARRQQGVVRRSQLIGVGLSRGAIRRCLECGELHRLLRGVYAVGPVVPPRAKEMAAVLACGPNALLADWSAAGLWKLVAPTEDDTAPVHVLTVGRGSEHRPGIRVRRVGHLDPRDRASVDGIPITSPARTLLDLAPRIGSRVLEGAVALAEREGLVTGGELARLIVRRRGRPGTPELRALLQRADGPALTRSEAEDRFLDLIRAARLPPPEANARLGSHEVDFLWRGHGIAVEVDGYRFHSSRPSFERDRRRLAQLAALGVHVIPLTWRQIVEEGTATAVQLGQALLRARLGRSGI